LCFKSVSTSQKLNKFLYVSIEKSRVLADDRKSVSLLSQTDSIKTQFRVHKNLENWQSAKEVCIIMVKIYKAMHIYMPFTTIIPSWTFFFTAKWKQNSTRYFPFFLFLSWLCKPEVYVLTPTQTPQHKI
jgi:hypothetical protein